MDFIAYGLLAYIPLLLFTGLLGLAAMPASFRGDDRASLLFAPAVGAAVWCALTVPLGLLWRYDSVLLWPALLVAVAFIIMRRCSLAVRVDNACALFALVAALASVLVLYCLAPIEMDGGLYLGKAALLDHCKAAMVESIATHGLPPLSPWLADNGQPVPVAYYFSWHAMAAQLCLFTGMSGYLADVTFAGFNTVLVFLGMGGLVLRLGGGRGALALLAVLLLLNAPLDNWLALLPDAWQQALAPPRFPGYWVLLSNLVWTCQHQFSAMAVLLTILAWLHLLKSTSGREALPLAALMGLLAAAAFLTSVYAGIFALLIFVVCVLPLACVHGDFRRDFIRTFPWQVLAAAIGVLLALQFVFYLFSFLPEERPLALGVEPSYDAGGPLDTVLHFLNFYGYVLPWRMGLAHVFGVVAMFVPMAMLRGSRFGFCSKLFTLATFLLIFVVHSTFFTNDYGWRSTSAAQILLVCFAAVGLERLHAHLGRAWDARARKRSFVALVLVLALAGMTLFSQAFDGIGFTRRDPAEHRAFAASARGWEVVQKHTSVTDMVLCHPDAFAHVSTPYDDHPDWRTNPFFALFARRHSPLGCLLYAKVYSEHYSQKKLNERHKRITAFFAGDPAADAVAFVRDDLQVKAILVTPQDGLWLRPGALAERYAIVAETDAYRVYLAR